MTKFMVDKLQYKSNEIEWEKNTCLKNVEVFIEINIHKEYHPTINMSLQGNVLEVYMMFQSELK